MKMRYLKPNKGTSLPQEVCYLGVAGERYPSKKDKRHELVLFDSFVARFTRIVDGKNTRCHTCSSHDPATFWTYLDNRCCRSRPLHIFVYDATSALTLLGFWRRLDVGQYHRGGIIDSDPPVIINAYVGTGGIRCVDVRNYFDMPIEELGMSFGVIANWYRWLDGDNSNEYDEAEYRCNVAEQSISSLMSTVRQHDLGRWKTTISLQAMQAYRHRFAPRSASVSFGESGSNSCEPRTIEKVFPLTHDDREIKAFERSANYSGQDECYFVGHVIKPSGFFASESDFPFNRNGPWIYGPVYHVDCNSLYPYLMKTCKYPRKLTGFNHEATPDHLRSLLAKYCVIARVLVDSETDVFPVRRDNRVLYCTGKFWTTLAGKELEFASLAGAICRVGYHTCYEPMDLFSAYVDYFYSLKCKYAKHCNDAMYLVAKCFLNSLQGKFSQRGKRWVDRPSITPVIDDKTGKPIRWGRWFHVDHDSCERNKLRQPGQAKEQEVFRYRAVAGETQEEINDDEANFSLPAIGALVTSNARDYMSSIRGLCGERNVLYQGTDSLLLLEPGYRALCNSGLISTDKLGHFRLKGEYASCTIRDAQDYKLGTTKTIRGLPRTAVTLSQRVFQFSQRQTLEGMLMTVPGERITYTTVAKSYDHAYDGGVVGKDGWVTPFHLNYAGDRGDAWEGEEMAGSKGSNSGLLPQNASTANSGDGRQVQDLPGHV